MNETIKKEYSFPTETGFRFETRILEKTGLVFGKYYIGYSVNGKRIFTNEYLSQTTVNRWFEKYKSKYFPKGRDKTESASDMPNFSDCKNEEEIQQLNDIIDNLW